MPRVVFVLVVCLAAQVAVAAEPIVTTVESSLQTDRENIRQFLFDNNEKTFFRSQRPPTQKDHVTIRFDREIELKSLQFKTADPDRKNHRLAAQIELSADGQKFVAAGSLHNDQIRWTDSKSEGHLGRVVAVRIKPKVEHKTPVIIREVAIHSSPNVHHYRYPIEITVDTSDSPQLRESAKKIAAICTVWYPRICQELATAGYKPPTHIQMTFTSKYEGVAVTSGNRITGSAKWFSKHPDDVGAMIHETTHVVQHYRGPNNPGWLIEGMTDYYRFFIYEPGSIGHIARDPHYNKSYRTTAAFLAFLDDKYDKQLLKKLNKSLREGTYQERMFHDATGKTLPELDAEWRASLGLKP